MFNHALLEIVLIASNQYLSNALARLFTFLLTFLTHLKKHVFAMKSLDTHGEF